MFCYRAARWSQRQLRSWSYINTNTTPPPTWFIMQRESEWKWRVLEGRNILYELKMIYALIKRNMLRWGVLSWKKQRGRLIQTTALRWRDWEDLSLLRSGKICRRDWQLSIMLKRRYCGSIIEIYQYGLEYKRLVIPFFLNHSARSGSLEGKEYSFPEIHGFLGLKRFGLICLRFWNLVQNQPFSVPRFCNTSTAE